MTATTVGRNTGAKGLEAAIHEWCPLPETESAPGPRHLEAPTGGHGFTLARNRDPVGSPNYTVLFGGSD